MYTSDYKVILSTVSLLQNLRHTHAVWDLVFSSICYQNPHPSAKYIDHNQHQLLVHQLRHKLEHEYRRKLCHALEGNHSNVQKGDILPQTISPLSGPHVCPFHDSHEFNVSEPGPVLRRIWPLPEVTCRYHVFWSLQRHSRSSYHDIFATQSDEDKGVAATSWFQSWSVWHDWRGSWYQRVKSKDC